MDTSKPMQYSLKLSVKNFFLCAMTLWTIPACHAEDNELQEGMNDYRKHDWSEALSHLGAALPNEFNNANLHYHMANCLVHMRQKESAIREYRIAYALDPQGRIGNYSKMCLHLFGIDAAGFLPMPEAPAKIQRNKDKEVDTLAKKDSTDSKDSKDSKDSGLAKVAKYVTEEDLIRQNLQDLMQSKHRPGSAKLQEVGTNVFVRNYKEPPKAGQTIADNEKSPGATPAQQGTKSGDKQASKPADKSATKTSDKPASKPADKPTNKSADKPTNKSTDKPADKPTNKSADKPSTTPAKKAN
ncbi:MAG: hypothetical protein HYX67_01850 [Candidatus Melainabacteria bacterium]|nr:hypothetical protein [Candidatus Melainabacteria bacterium]